MHLLNKSDRFAQCIDSVDNNLDENYDNRCYLY